jgi:hypothetical protein
MHHPMKMDRPLDFFAGILSYLVPGLGQIIQGRFTKGLFFMVALLGLFHVGQAMGNWRNVYVPPHAPAPANQQRNLLQSLLDRNLYYYGQFWIGIAAWPAIWQHLDQDKPPAINAANGTESFWQNFQRAPQSFRDFDRLNDDVRAAKNKDLDLGLIYTMVAGLLNLLVIYDAIAGAAFPEHKAEPLKGVPA